MDAPKLMHVVISLAHGGLERLVVDWTNERNRRYQCSTYICCLDDPGDLAGDVVGGAAFSVNAQRRQFPWDMMAVKRLRARLTGQPGTQVVHSHNLSAQQYSVLATVGTGLRHVHTWHGIHLDPRSWVNRARNHVLGRLTHRVVSVSDAIADTMCRITWTARERITVIPNGTSVQPEFTAGQIDRLRAELKIPDHTFVIGSVGRIARVKGYDRLLEVFPFVSSAKDSDGHGPVLLLVGDGPEVASLERQATGLGIRDRIIFAGFRPDARALLELMDLFVLPSRSEGMSVATLEAMSAGCPVMVTDVGENRLIVDDGGAGTILPDDEQQWAALISRHIAESCSSSDSGRVVAARRRVEELFSLARTMDAYDELYRRVVPGIDAR